MSLATAMALREVDMDPVALEDMAGLFFQSDPEGQRGGEAAAVVGAAAPTLKGGVPPCCAP